MLNFCKHKYGIVQSDGYQYCSKCGKTIIPPSKNCDHTWEIYNYIDNVGYSGRVLSQIIVNRCSKCGIINQIKLTT